MALIITEIAPQNFELIRDKIGEILSVELANQWSAFNRPGSLPVVWVGRIIPFDKTEIPAINVSLASIDFSNKDAKSVDGIDSFNIDIYTSAPFSEGSRGDAEALMLNHMIAGLCRSILENPVYRTLGFATPFCSTTGVVSIRFLDPVTNSDATNQTVGRLQFDVRCTEGVSFQPTIDLKMSSTNIKLNKTNLGYRYEVA